MSIERDYLMRQLMQLFDVLSKILGHRKKGERDEAESQIRYFYKILKIEMDVRELSIEEMLKLLQDRKKFNNEQIEIFAFVLKEQGELAQAENDRLNFFQKAHFLLNKVEGESTAFSMDRQMKLAELRSYLNSN